MDPVNLRLTDLCTDELDNYLVRLAAKGCFLILEGCKSSVVLSLFKTQCCFCAHAHLIFTKTYSCALRFFFFCFLRIFVDRIYIGILPCSVSIRTLLHLQHWLYFMFIELIWFVGRCKEKNTVQHVSSVLPLVYEVCANRNIKMFF